MNFSERTANIYLYMNEDTKSGLKINYWFLLAVFAIIFISAMTTIFFSLKTNALTNKKMAETTEAKRPANLDLVIITDANCKDCFNLNPILDNLKKENVKINFTQTIDSAGEEGKQLIAKLGIKKLPTFLVKGELHKNAVLAKFFSSTGEIVDGTFVFRQVGGPYLDTNTGKISGMVSVVMIIDSTCVECYDVTQHELILKQFGMQPASKVVDSKSALGVSLVNAYKIKMIPAFILTGDVNAYPDFKAVWPQVGIVANDGAYVFTKGVPFMGVYKNLTTNKIITPAPKTNK